MLRKFAAGLTLLEILLVLSLLGVIAGIAVPHAHSFLLSLRLDSTARQIAMDLQLARMRAIARNATVSLRFYPSLNGYRLEESSLDNEVEVGPMTYLHQDITLLDLNTRENSISFMPRGNPAIFGTITLQNPHQAQKKIIVNMAGRIRIQ